MLVLFKKFGGAMDCETTNAYWDCECEDNYIKPKRETSCVQCHAIVDEQPDSRVIEVLHGWNDGKLPMPWEV